VRARLFPQLGPFIKTAIRGSRCCHGSKTESWELEGFLTKVFHPFRCAKLSKGKPQCFSCYNSSGVFDAWPMMFTRSSAKFKIWTSFQLPRSLNTSLLFDILKFKRDANQISHRLLSINEYKKFLFIQ
jgi:hypothetical protein